jgi:hypothetical protein
MAAADGGGGGALVPGSGWITGVDVDVEAPPEELPLALLLEARGVGVGTGSARDDALGAGSSKPGGSNDSGAFCASAQPEVSASAVPRRRCSGFT